MKSRLVPPLTSSMKYESSKAKREKQCRGVEA
jgi:hypothetical protein